MDVDTALSEVPANIMPLLDDTDFKTRETAVAYNAAGMDLVWNFVTSAGAYTQTAVTPTTSGNYDWTHQGDGMYSIEIPASGGASINNDTEGYGWFTGVATGVLPWRGPIIGFRHSAINDSLCDTNTTGLLAPTTAGRTLDVSAGGEAGVDWANVGSATTTVTLSGTTIKTATDVETKVDAIKTKTDFLPSATAGAAGGLMIAGSNAATTFATLTVSGATTLTGNVALSNGMTITQATLNGHGISVTGNGSGAGIRATGGNSSGTGLACFGGTSGYGIVGTGNGNADGLRFTGGSSGGNGMRCIGVGVGAGIYASGGTDASTSGLYCDSSGDGSGAIFVGSGLGIGISASGTTALNSTIKDEIADSVWDEATAGHSTAGTTGKALTDAGSAGDPWSTALPGAYGAGTAGKILGDNLNATVSSRASQTSLDTVDDFLDTEIAAIKAKTDQMTFTTANRIDSQVYGMEANVMTAAAAAADLTTELQSGLATAAALTTVDTVVDAIKAKTDNLTFTVAGQVDANAESMNGTEILGNGSSGDLWRG